MSASFDRPTPTSSATTAAASDTTNSMRRSTLSADTQAPPPSMADQLPSSIQLGFDGLRAHMGQFSSKFDGFVERSRKQVLEERNRFHLNLTELREDQRMHRRDIEILHLKSQTHAQTLDREASEIREMQAAVAEAETERETRAAEKERLRQEIADIQKTIAQRVEAQRTHAKQLDVQSRLNLPELEFWQELLCLRIEGAGKEDRLKIVYSHLVEKDWDKEAWFELDTGSQNYDIVHCRPRLERVVIERELRILNDNRDFGAFLKRMRKRFVTALKREHS